MQVIACNSPRSRDFTVIHGTQQLSSVPEHETWDARPGDRHPPLPSPHLHSPWLRPRLVSRDGTPCGQPTDRPTDRPASFSSPPISFYPLPSPSSRAVCRSAAPRAVTESWMEIDCFTLLAAVPRPAAVVAVVRTHSVTLHTGGGACCEMQSKVPCSRAQ